MRFSPNVLCSGMRTGKRTYEMLSLPQDITPDIRLKMAMIDLVNSVKERLTKTATAAAVLGSHVVWTRKNLNLTMN